MHVFVDESIRGGTYLLCAVRFRAGDLLLARATMRALCKPGQRRVHMAKEQPQRRREILAAVTGTPARARLYLAAGPPIVARATCLSRLLVDLGADSPPPVRLSLESSDGQDKRDRELIVAHRYAAPALDGMTYEHMRPHEEPLLAVPDVLAWAYGAGGDWRRRIGGVLDKVMELPAEEVPMGRRMRETRPSTVRRKAGSTSRG